MPLHAVQATGSRALTLRPCRRPCRRPTSCVHQLPPSGLVAVKEPRHSRCIAASAGEKEQDEPAVTYNKEFGYSRKDVVLIGVGLIAFGYALYYGLQATGLDPLMAGNVTQLIIIVGLCVLWVGSYVFRVMNKDMTYVKQLREYEDAVMAKRLEEMTEDEVQKMVDSTDAEKPSKQQQRS